MTLQLKMYAGSISLVNNNIEKTVFRVIVWSFAALTLWYVILLGNMVMNIVERRSLEKEALTLSSEVADLELTYLSLANTIDLAYSHALGFKETNIIFATRKSLGSLGPLPVTPTDNNEI